MAKRNRPGKAQLREWARDFKLLGDPTRLGILAELADRPQNVSSLCKTLKLKQPTISHHLGLLRMGRLVTSTRQGKSVQYSAEKANLKAMASALVRLTPK